MASIASAEPSLTTIKVSKETRHRLKAMAQRAHCTIDEYVNELIAIADREERWDDLRGAFANMTASQRLSYLSEADPYVRDTSWDGVTVAPEWQDDWDAHVAQSTSAAVKRPSSEK
jgi:ElaB/YqjD/DUF883 family membrane-anchored ribosome-binding protein